MAFFARRTCIRLRGVNNKRERVQPVGGDFIAYGLDGTLPGALEGGCGDETTTYTQQQHAPSVHIMFVCGM